MREYGIRKTEIYYVKANSSADAKALVDEMDNSYAWKVEVDVCYVSAEIEEWGACGACGEWSKGEHNCSEEVVNA